MLSRRALALLLIVAPTAAAAQEQTPSQFLQSIYEPYKKADFKGQPYWESERFFVPDVARAIRRDLAAAKTRNQPPILNGDPFVEAQDWQIASTATSVSMSGDKAAGVVMFRNQGEWKRLAIFLEKTPHGWRIEDIVGRGGSSLRALYKLK